MVIPPPQRPAGVIGGELDDANFGGQVRHVVAGVFGHDTTTKGARGVWGESTNGYGVYGESTQNEGVRGVSHSNAHAGVTGYNDGGQIAVYGESTQNEGVRGVSHSNAHAGVTGYNDGGRTGAPGDDGQPGVYGESKLNEGVRGVSHAGDHAGVVAVNDGGGLSFYGQGDAQVTGNLTVHDVHAHDVVLDGADCAEEFDTANGDEAGPGTVMVLDEDCAVRPSDHAYDRRVAGVISGAGNYRPGVILDKARIADGRALVALLGKVYCKVDAQYSAIEVGDLLTTSPTPGHAMKASDPARAFGAVLGKALRPLRQGRGLVPILIALQ